jgi:abortive infection bacteriophage resistance protein
MKYAKPLLSFDEQADLLLQRGMRGDRERIKQRLSSVSYYRLSGYWYPFRNVDDTFKQGTEFDVIWTRYAFDRRLRLLVMDAVERIEIAARTQLSYNHAQRHGPFAYAKDPLSLPKLNVKSAEYQKFLSRVREETDRSRERFVDHFENKYGDCHDFLPVWMATEVMSFGTILTFYKGSSHQVKTAVATYFRIPEKVFETWLFTLNATRNICAHHGRLWNRELGIKPFIPYKNDYPDWHSPAKIQNNRVFAVLTICSYCMRLIAPQSNWSHRLKVLLSEYSEVPIPNMGFPSNWLDCPIWKW